ncbi:MAG TPA: serpin family protein [Nocardioidaceae bacterium]
MDMPIRRDMARTVAVVGLAATALASLSACGSGADEIGAASSDVRRVAGEPEAVPAVVASLDAFAADLYRSAAAGSEENLVLSPYSVATALAMTLNGARGATAQEMEQVLRVDGLDDFNRGMNALTRAVESRAGEHELPDGGTGEVVLSTAGSLWGQQELAWRQDFLDVLAREYGAGLRLVDYRTDPEHAAGLVNDWVADRTDDKITELVPEGTLSTDTRLVLVNAIHLKAPWEEPFEGAAEKVPFELLGGETVEVEMMAQMMAAAAYAASGPGEPGWVGVRLPYLGSELAMAVVVPDDLTSFEERLDGEVLGDLLGRFDGAERPVRVVMPRWDLRSRLSLAEVLAELGMPTAFDPARADLSGMTAEERLFISHVLHEATITVDEEGTEAAAATGVVAGVTGLPTEPAEVVADRPFLFVLYDVATGAPLFVGRVTDPR